MLDEDTIQNIRQKFNLFKYEVNELFCEENAIPQEIITHILSSDHDLIKDTLLVIKNKYVKTISQFITVIIMLTHCEFLKEQVKIGYIHEALGKSGIINDDRYVHIIYKLAWFYALTQNINEAEKRFTEISNIPNIEFREPTIYVQTIIYLTNIYATKQQYKKSIKVLKEALDSYKITEEQTTRIKIALGKNYLSLNQYEIALTYLEPLLELLNDKQNTLQEDVIFYLATLYKLQNNYIKAKQYFDLLLKRDLQYYHKNDILSDLFDLETINNNWSNALKITQEILPTLELNSYDYVRFKYLKARATQQLREFEETITITNELLDTINIKANPYFIDICFLKLDCMYYFNNDLADKKQTIELLLSAKNIKQHIFYFNFLYDQYENFQSTHNVEKCKEIKNIFDTDYKKFSIFNSPQSIKFLICYVKINGVDCMKNDHQFNHLEENILNNDTLTPYLKKNCLIDIALLYNIVGSNIQALKILKNIDNPDRYALNIQIDVYMQLRKFNQALKIINQLINEDALDNQVDLTIKKLACLSDLKQYGKMDKILTKPKVNTTDYKETKNIQVIYDIYEQYFCAKLKLVHNKYTCAYKLFTRLFQFIKKFGYESKLMVKFYQEIQYQYYILQCIVDTPTETLSNNNLLEDLNTHANNDFKKYLVRGIFDCFQNKNNDDILTKLDNTIQFFSSIIKNNLDNKSYKSIDLLHSIHKYLQNIYDDFKYVINHKEIEFIRSVDAFNNIKLSVFTQTLYRGMNKVSWDIEPNIIREKKLDQLESYYLENFKREAYTLSNLSFTDYKDLDWLSLMQHHGNYSPLLDWTRSLNMALFFALYDENHQNAGIPVICTMEYDTIETHNEVQKLLDKKQTESIVLFAPNVLHERLNRQSGVFTYHPSQSLNIEDKQNTDFYIKRYALSPAITDDLENLLQKDNIKCSTVYPDLDNLSKDLKDNKSNNFIFYSDNIYSNLPLPDIKQADTSKIIEEDSLNFKRD